MNGPGAAGASTGSDRAARLVRLLAARGETLATAESLTGGRLAALVTGVPGASRVFLGGVVSYATVVKTDLLAVPEDLVAREGVVSEACARAMAIGVRRLLGSTWGVSTTGVAGPDLQEGKDVGTVYLGLAGPDGASTTRLSLSGGREEIQQQTGAHALEWLARVTSHPLEVEE